MNIFITLVMVWLSILSSSAFAQEAHGSSALAQLFNPGHDEFETFYIDRGTKCDKEKIRKFTDKLQKVLNQGADINAVDESFGTPLILAVYRATWSGTGNCYGEVIDFLLAQGANPNVPGTASIPLYFAVTGVPVSVEIVQKLCKAGANKSAVVATAGNSALEAARMSANPSVIKALELCSDKQ